MNPAYPDNEFASGREPVAGRDLSRRVSIPDHELIRCIGQGSYGAVWLARNMMGVFRAIKIVFRNSFKDARPFERELSGIRKFEPISRSHEGFIDVLHVGINEAEGYFYYVMELGDDETSGPQIDPQVYFPKTLAREIASRRRVPVRDCLKLGLALTAALAELHRHGLVHRDIKPSNIIFVNGVPKLADIGLVADANEARSYVGTEGFIPPEGPGTPSADIYSLGKVLYEASTGRDRQDFPELPTNWDDPREHAQLVELNEIVLQACKPEASDRYPSARAMLAHLLVLENGQSVKRLRYLEQMLARAKRLATVATVGLIVIAGIGYHFYREHRFAVEARQRQFGANLVNGAKAIESSDFLAALPYFIEVLSLDEQDAARAANDRLRIGSVLDQSPKITQMFFAQGEITRMEFAADATRLLIAERSGHVQIVDSHSGKPLTPALNHKYELDDAHLSSDGSLVVTAARDQIARVWNVASGAILAAMLHTNEVRSVAISPDDRLVATACDDGFARVWEVARTNVITQIPHKPPVLAVAFSRDGRRLVSCGNDGLAVVSDPLSGKRLFDPLPQADRWVQAAAFNPGGDTLVVACYNSAHIWDLSGPTPHEVLPALKHSDRVFSVDYSPDGRWIVTGSLDGTVRLWDADTHQPLVPNAVLRHTDRVISVDFAPDGHRVLTSCFDGTGRVWDLAAPNLEPAPRAGIFSADGSRLLATNNGIAQLVDSLTLKPAGEQFEFNRPNALVALDRSGRLLTCVSNSSPGANVPAVGRLEIWNTETGKLAMTALSFTNRLKACVLNPVAPQVCVLMGKTAQLFDSAKAVPLSDPLPHPGNIIAAFFSPDRRRLAAWGGNWLKVWDLATYRELFPTLEVGFGISYAEFSPDSSLLVICARNGNFTHVPALVFDAQTGRKISELKHRDGVLCANFSPDSKKLVTGSEDFTAIIWDPRTGSQLAPVLPHLDQVMSVGFSEDGKRVLTASHDKSARVWDAETGDPLTPPLPHLHELQEARFLPGGRQILTVDINMAHRVWTLPSDNKPLEDLNNLARLLSGDTIIPAGRAQPPATEPLAGLWHRLRALYPAQFEVPENQIAAWYDLAAKQCESEHRWLAAAFHLDHLMALRPNDPSISNRLDRARSLQVTAQ